MSRFTTEVRYICATYAGRTDPGDYTDINEIIADSQDAVIGDYPIFDENYRSTLNTKILKHYYTREISEETVGLWKLRLNTRMNEIMPYYNKLYESELLKFNPLYDVDLYTTHSGTESKNETNSEQNQDDRTENKSYSNQSERVGTESTSTDTATDSTSNSVNDTENKSEGNTSNQANSKGNTLTTGSDQKNTVDKYSDTPQGAITGLADDNYLTNARMVENNDSNTQNSSQNAQSEGSSQFSENGSSTSSATNTASEKGKANSNTENTDKTNSIATENMSAKRKGERNGSRDIASTEDYLEHVYGKRDKGYSYAKLLQEFRDTFLNIDMLIITNLSDLFFGLWE